MIRHRHHALLCIALVALCASMQLPAPLQAQVSTARLEGMVRDSTGASVNAAAITVRSRAGGEPHRTASDAAGRFTFDVPSGRYVLEVAARGFTVQRLDIAVDSRRARTIDVTVDIAPVRVAVDVVASAAPRPAVVETDPRAPRQPMPAHDGADYLKTVPGFAVVRKGGTDGDPIFRGMGGSRLGVLLDGEHILGGCGNRMDPPTAYVFPGAFERVTVVKGPQTVLHGPGHSAGIVLFEQADRHITSPGVSVFASTMFGTAGRRDAIADVRGGTGRVDGRVSATRAQSDDYRDGDGRRVNSSYHRWSVNGAIGWTPRSATRVQVSGAISDGRAAYADRMMDGVAFSRQNLGLRFTHQTGARVLTSLDAHVFYNYVDHVMDNYTLRRFVPTMMMPTPAASNPDRRTVGARTTSSWIVTPRTRAIVGVDWQGNQHRLRSSANQLALTYDTRPRVRDASFNNLGAFAEVTRTVGLASQVVMGGRLDRWTANDRRRLVTVGMGAMASTLPNPTAETTRSATLPSGFLRYEASTGSATTLYAGIGYVRRAPDYWELFNKESTASISAFETRVERIRQLDVGIRHRLARTSLSAALFASSIQDFILIHANYGKAPVARGPQTMSRPATITRNVDTRSWGGEATAAITLTRSLTVDGSLAFVRGTNSTDDRPLAQQPPVEGRVAVKYATARWSLGALARLVGPQRRFAPYQGGIAGQDMGPSVAFRIVSANGAMRVSRAVLLSAGVDNVLDRTYAEFVSRSGADIAGFVRTTRINEPGRTLWIKLDFTR